MMHSFLSRLNAIFAFSFTCLAAVTFLCFLSTSFAPPPMEASLSITRLQLEKRAQFPRFHKTTSDLAIVSFSLFANLTNMFDWNTKEIFLYVAAEYTTEKHSKNQVVLWDKIVMRHDTNRIINLSNMPSKYLFFDDGHGLLNNNNVTVSLYWNAIQYAGKLPIQRAASTQISFSDQYGVQERLSA